ncbi:hypothetical protein ACTMTJ_42510 [Phytohabitans sp. LJ34]|uniref:hypothetical protein n=1 Tax=Phytohabitans sp. LJ34 TaxID=3452217 RepID=UPI003F8B57B7
MVTASVMMIGVKPPPRDEPPDDAIVWQANGDALTWQASWGIIITLSLLTLGTTAYLICEGQVAPFVVTATPLALLVGHAWRCELLSAAEIRLTPADRPVQVTVRQRNGTTTTFPISDVSRLVYTWIHSANETEPVGAAVRLKLERRTVVTRDAYPGPPAGWLKAFAAAGVPITHRHKYLPEADQAVGP